MLIIDYGVIKPACLDKCVCVSVDIGDSSVINNLLVNISSRIEAALNDDDHGE